jgi:hypothetical protein
MSLQIWLPLTETVNNQGLSNVTITNVGVNVNHEGKLGYCYNFNGIDSRIASSSKIWNYPLSVCGWFKPSGLSGTQYWVSYNTATGTAGGHAIGIGSSGTSLVVYYGGTSSTIASVTLSNNKWYHVAVCVGSNKAVQAYVNGELKLATTCSSQPASAWFTVGARSNASTGATGGAADFFKGQMNDVRLYNSVLSPRAIKRMTQALNVHYLLNEDSIDTTDVFDASGYQKNAQAVGTITYNTTTMPKYNAATILASNAYINCGEAHKVVSDACENFSINVWAYKDNWAGDWTIYSCNENGGFKLSGSSSAITASIGIYTSTSILTTSDSQTITYSTGSTAFISVDLGSIDNSITNSLTSGWHMFTFTFDTTGTKIYVDGAIANTVSTNSLGCYLAYTDLLLGAESASTPTTPYLNGQLSDFRIYGTTLTATEILSLYNNGAYIDSSGTIYGEIR